MYFYVLRKFSGLLQKNLFKLSAKCVDLKQGLLKLLWTVYSGGKLQSFMELRNFKNPFNKDKSVGL